MFRREGKYRHEPTDKDSRFERIGLFVLAIFLLQVKRATSVSNHTSETDLPNVITNQSIHSFTDFSHLRDTPVNGGPQLSRNHSSNYVENKRTQQPHVILSDRNLKEKSSSTLSNSEGTDNSLHMFEIHTNSSLASSSFNSTVLTYALNSGARSNGVTHVLNNSTNPQINSSSSIKAKKRRNKARNENKLSSDTPSRVSERNNSVDIAKTVIRSKKGKRRKYNSPVFSGKGPQHRGPHHWERRLERPLSGNPVNIKSTGNEFTTPQRSLGLSNKHPILRHGGEQVLFRFKRGDVLINDAQEPVQNQLSRKEKKGHVALLKHPKQRSVPVPNVPVRTGYPAKSVLRKADLTSNFKDLTQHRNIVSKVGYGQLPSRGPASSQYPYVALGTNQNGWRKSVSSNIEKPLSSSKVPAGYRLQNANQFVQLMPSLSERKNLQSDSVTPARILNAAGTAQTRIPSSTNFQNGLGHGQANSKLSSTGLIRKQLIPSSRNAFYSYGPPQSLIPQLPFVHVNPQVLRYPQAPQRLLPSGPQANSVARGLSPVLPQTSNHLINKGDFSALTPSGQKGLLMYLNFEDIASGKSPYAYYNGDLAGAEKRTKISSYFGSCGKIARINNGSEILLNGAKIKVKPRKAISIAAWIKVDTNRGYHSIFDTIGGHSLHKQGQYHFEIQDGSIRWFHRNESNVQIFSVETAPLIAANKWNHIVGTYDSHTGTAKVFLNGRLKAEAAGNGFLSQDWDAHAGIGKHKDARFLQGEVDEFRIYNKALTQKDIYDLMKICNFQRACGGFFYSPTGTIESPEWPGHYKGKTHCTWRVSVDPGEKISLHFNSFKLEEDGSCDKAKLVARDGDNKDANVLGVYCGTKRPLEIATSGNHLWLQFTSMKGADGKGFLLYYDTASSHLTKKTESPPLPFSDTQRCAVTLPKYNVTLVGGIKSGTFSEAKHVHDIDLCTRRCCLRRDCDLAFMIRDTCYLVKCANDLLCQTKRARPSNMNPRISFVSHLSSINLEPQISIDGTAESKWTTPGPTSKVASAVQPVCHHTAVSYNVTLVGGISAGKFSTYGTTKTIDQCIRHCCHDNKCDIAFMIQGNCYAVECADIEGCQVKRAKPSVYHPTVAYVYRGNGRPIGDPLPSAEKPSPDACSPFTVSNTVYNVTLQGGIKAGNFTDKGVVKNMDECAAFCCADEGCNVAFLIRDNCFTVACKGYDSCKMKPALSEYYHPRLAYVNWSPPDDEIPANRWYASLGCWKDTDSFAVATLEGSDPLLKGSLAEREKPIDTCAQVAGKHNYKVFAIQNGGACLGGPTAGRMFNQFGESSACKNGTGGLFVNDVYRLKDSGSYVSLGCWNDSIDHALPLLEHTDPILEDSYQSRPDPLLKCGQVARRKGFVIFAIQRGGMCFGGSRAEIDYRKFGISRKCHNGLGGSYANNVYRLIDNLGAKPTESTDNITVPPAGTSTPNADSSENTTPNTNPSGSSNPNTTPTGSSTPQTTPTGSSTPNTTPTGSATSALPSDVVGTQRSPTTSPSPSTYIEENYLTLQDDLPHRNTYTAGEILHNVTLKYGIKAGRFSDKGKVANMTDCVRACGKLETCSLAFMLGKQCFSVSCYNEALCGTKPAFSPFYKPKIAYVKHKKEPVTGAKPLADLSQCRTSIVHNDVTLVGGIHAGKFTDLGDAENMSICSERCCLKDTCDVAFMLEGECYGVSCVNESMCETRPARNPSRYNPKVAYIHHEKAKDKVSPRPKLQSLLSMMDRLLNDQPQKQTPVNFTPVNGTYADTTALSLDTDLSNDVGNHVSSDVSYQPNKLSSDQQMDRKNIGDTFLKDDSTPSTSAENYEGLVNSVKDGQMNVYDIPYYFDDNEMQSKKFKSYLKSPPNKILKNMDGYYGTAQDSNSDLKTLNPVNQRIWTGISPGLDWTYNTELKDIEKFLQNDRNIRIGDGNEAKVASSYYDSNYQNPLSKTTGDRFSNYEKLHLGQTENTPQDVLSDSLSFDMQDNTHGSQTVNSDLSVSPLVSTQQKNPVCWDGQILYNYTLVGGINAGTFTDNGKTTNMDLCMQSCCKRESCDLAFMIEDDCYSVACNSNGACEPRKARPTHYNPRIAIRKKAQGDYHIKGFPTEPASSTQSTPSTPTSSPSSASSETSVASSPTPVSSVTQPHQDGFGTTPIKVTHSCDATPIEYNVTLKMGLHSGIFQKIGRVDTMDDCIEMSCRHEKSDVAFMLGSMCFAVSCYSDDLCKTVPIFGSSISRLNLNPAISFLRKKAHLRTESLGLQSEATEPDKCRDSTITYNVTLRGGIDAGNFTERGGILSMRDCIGKCCDDKTCDLAFMFGDSCYSVECKSEKLCQAVLAKPSRLEPKVSYVTRGYLEDKDKGTMFSVDDQTPTCRADQKSRSEVVSNKTLVGGLEAGKFSFVGVVSDMGMCMDRCCAQRDCNVAYMVDKNCFAISCYSPSLCKISDVSSTNGDVEISTIMNSTTEKPAEKHSMVVYVIIGVVGFIAGAGGILWAVCMFVRRHRLRSRHTQDTD